jgi:hypothetical protein
MANEELFFGEQGSTNGPHNDITRVTLETAVDRCYFRKIPDFIKEFGKKDVTHLVSALQARLLVSRLPSVLQQSMLCCPS